MVDRLLYGIYVATLPAAGCFEARIDTETDGPVQTSKFESADWSAEGYTSPMKDETLELMQTKIAFLERAASELSDVVFRQHREIQAMEAKLRAITLRLNGASTDESARPLEHEVPPHY